MLYSSSFSKLPFITYILGHATAAFTLDVYGHVTDQMKRESAKCMESYIKGILGA